jgi:(1->4)-alpha-D-glucan 1-alpha-D-glucosylmutase
VPFQQKIARLGMLNSLSQLILKIGSPGVPDIYQGTELWDLSLVDPDNRRPVDFGIRERWLQDLLPLLENRPRPEGASQILEEMLKNWEDGRIKLFCTAAALRLRRRMVDVFAGGDYVPLTAEGAAAKHVVAFGRVSGARRVVVVAPRLVAGLYGFGTSLHPWPAVWGDTTLALPKEWSGDRYRNIFTAEIISGMGAGTGIGERRELRLADILSTWPVAMLENDSEDSL